MKIQITPLQKVVLLETQRRTQELAEIPRPPADWHCQRIAYDAEIEHGPQYSGLDWFGPKNASQQYKLLRDIRKLEALGLLTVNKADGRRITNLQLTTRGLNAVSQLNPVLED
ncbi:hypothetical protein [Bythopirellula polymerisocia]|nr:hypothetical protein [Bythopirellula polymerisocia]